MEISNCISNNLGEAPYGTREAGNSPGLITYDRLECVSFYLLFLGSARGKRAIDPPSGCSKLIDHLCQLRIKAVLLASGAWGRGAGSGGGVHASGAGWVSLTYPLLTPREASQTQ